jgi:hypothetical protein
MKEGDLTDTFVAFFVLIVLIRESVSIKKVFAAESTH